MSAAPKTAAASTPAPETSPKATGRPRSAAAESAIIEATLALVAERGVDGAGIEAIAARAGVGKTTIYRRWDNKEALIVDALSSLADPLPALPGTSMRDDLVLLVDAIRVHSTRTAGKLLVCLAANETPELWDAYMTRVIEPRREAMRDVLRRGHDSGELLPDVQVELAHALLAGPMLAMTRIWRDDVNAQTATTIVDTVLRGIGAQK